MTLKNLLPLFFGCCALCACEETENSDQEYKDWQQRNANYFNGVRADAKKAIKDAQAQYGDQWTEHCEWRTYLKYSLEATEKHKATDSIYVEILKRGVGEGTPCFTDSVRVNYRGRLMPSASYTEGLVFDYSGTSPAFDIVFNPQLCAPAMFHVGSVVRGLSTALQQMHIGDIWRVYIPNELGYAKTEKNDIPPYSTLIFETELVGFYRTGTIPPPHR